MKKALKTRQSAPDFIRVDVAKYSVNIISGTSGDPARECNIKNSTGLIRIEGINSRDWKFSIYIYPDATTLTPAFLRPDDSVVQMNMHQWQVECILKLLKTSDQAHALYRVDAGVVYADVHGEFKKTPAPLTDI